MSVVAGAEDILGRAQRLQLQLECMQKKLDTQRDTLTKQDERIKSLSLPIAQADAVKPQEQEYSEDGDALYPPCSKKKWSQPCLNMPRISFDSYISSLEKKQQEEQGLISEITMLYLAISENPKREKDELTAIDSMQKREFEVNSQVLSRLVQCSSSTIRFVLRELKKNRVAPPESIALISTVIRMSEKAEVALRRKDIVQFRTVTPNHEAYVRFYLNKKMEKQPDITLKEGLEYLNFLWQLAEKKQVVALLHKGVNVEVKAFESLIDIFTKVTRDEALHIIHFEKTLRGNAPLPSSGGLLHSKKQQLEKILIIYFLKDTFCEATFLQGLSAIENTFDVADASPIYTYLFAALKAYGDAARGRVAQMEEIVQGMPKVRAGLKSTSLYEFGKMYRAMSDLHHSYYSIGCESYKAKKKLYEIADHLYSKFKEWAGSERVVTIDISMQARIAVSPIATFKELLSCLQYVKDMATSTDAAFSKEIFDTYDKLACDHFILVHIERELGYRAQRQHRILQKTQLIEDISEAEDEHINNAEIARKRQELVAVNKDLPFFDQKIVSHCQELREALQGRSAKQFFMKNPMKELPIEPHTVAVLGEIDDELQFALSGDSRVSHFKRVFHDFTVPHKPEKAALEDLTKLFEATKFPETENTAALRATLLRFIDQIKTRKHIVGTPRDEGERRKFYETMELPLIHTVDTLLKLPESDTRNTKRVEAMQELLEAAGYCGTKQLFSCFDLYQKVVLKIPVDLKSMLYTNLGKLREFFLRHLTPPRDQSVHYFMTALRKLGPELGIPGATRFRNYKDEYEDIGGVFAIDEVRADFMRLYTVSEIIKNCRMELGPKGRQEFRDAFNSWAVRQMPSQYGEEHLGDYDGLEMEIACKIAEGKEPAEVRQFLQRHPQAPVQVRPDEDFADAIAREKEAARQDLYLRQEVYEDMDTWKVKQAHICNMLVAFDVLKKI